MIDADCLDGCDSIDTLDNAGDDMINGGREIDSRLGESDNGAINGGADRRRPVRADAFASRAATTSRSLLERGEAGAPQTAHASPGETPASEITTGALAHTTKLGVSPLEQSEVPPRAMRVARQPVARKTEEASPWRRQPK